MVNRGNGAGCGRKTCQTVINKWVKNGREQETNGKELDDNGA